MDLGRKLSDSTLASCKDTKSSVAGWSAEIEGMANVIKSRTIKGVNLSITAVECMAATFCVQDMVYGKCFLESLGLKVKLPMVLHMDNKAGVDIFNSWTVSGATRSLSIWFAYIRE